MRVILIPGFWLNASSWEVISDALEDQGHEVTAMTLPGMSSPDDDRSEVGLRDCVEAIVTEIDRSAGPVVLVGHSGGGAMSHAAADARPDAVARVIYVDSFPSGEGECINDGLQVVNGEIPLPEWSDFDEADLVDLTEELRTTFRAVAIPEPARVARDPQVLVDPRRYDVASTIICCEFTSDQLRRWLEEKQPWLAELGAMTDVTYVDLPTGHWPQFTKPRELARALLSAIAMTR